MWEEDTIEIELIEKMNLATFKNISIYMFAFIPMRVHRILLLRSKANESLRWLNIHYLGCINFLRNDRCCPRIESAKCSFHQECSNDHNVYLRCRRHLSRICVISEQKITSSSMFIIQFRYVQSTGYNIKSKCSRMR